MNLPAVGLAVLGRSDAVLFHKGAGKIGQIMEAGISDNRCPRQKKRAERTGIKY